MSQTFDDFVPARYPGPVTTQGVLELQKAGRENLYINPPLLALLAERKRT